MMTQPKKIKNNPNVYSYGTSDKTDLNLKISWK